MMLTELEAILNELCFLSYVFLGSDVNMNLGGDPYENWTQQVYFAWG